MSYALNEDIRGSIKARHKDATGNVGVLSAFAETEAKASPNGDRYIRIVVTTDDIDLVGDVVDPKGCDTSYINAKGQNKVFADHRYDIKSCVGKLRYMSKWPNPNNTRGLMASIAMLSGSPLAEDCWKIAKEIGIGASIGFEAMEVTDYKAGDPPQWKSASGIIRKWRLLEVSLTCLPCNVSCQSEGVEAPDESKMARLGELVTKGIIQRSTAEHFGLDFKPPRVRIISA